MTLAGREQAGRRAGKVWAPLTSLVGRTADAAQLTRLLDAYRLVTITGPGGVGKTRLAAEVARRMADRFPDGAWLIELGAVADPAHVPTEVMSALGVPQAPGRPPLEVLAEALAPRRLLLVLDNCEHVLDAVADLCAALLSRADDVRVLATSREQLGMMGETRYRLAPLELPGSDKPGAMSQSAAALFIERARQADPRFAFGPQDAPLVTRVVTRLDGMPLAIELAAARVEALGLVGLADRIDDALQLLGGKDAFAPSRHRSLAAVADWSYQLLTEPEQRVFRRLAVFPGAFTLEAAEAVAGPEAGPAVLRLVDCSLLVPPRQGSDHRGRYTMLQTLHDYALSRLRETGEERPAAAALAAYAWSVAKQAAAGLATRDGELRALGWFDAEDATLTRALSWTLDHDPDSALRLATALVPWLRLRGRDVEARTWLISAVAGSSTTDETWATAQVWLGSLAAVFGDPDDNADHYTAVIDAYRHREPSPVLVRALGSGRAMERMNQGNVPGAVDDARRALALARELDDAASELLALSAMSAVACYAGDAAEALDWARQAQELLPSDIPGEPTRWCHYVLALVLTDLGELDSARRVCASGLTLARQVDDRAIMNPLLGVIADVERLAGNLADAGLHLREAIDGESGMGRSMNLANFIEKSSYLCAAQGRWTDAITLYAAYVADQKRHRQSTNGPVGDGSQASYRRQVEQALSPIQRREAEERGARMSLSAAREFAIMAAVAAGQAFEEPAPSELLTPRERELVTLVAQGHTNAEIAGRLYISVRTVASHLDRIRNKTGHRRRADLTRLAIQESLV